MQDDEPDWSVVRAQYETGHDTLDDIAARHGISRAELGRAKRDGGWSSRRGRSAGRAKLTRRLMGVIDRLVETMEAHLAQGKDIDPAQTRLLETMVKTLEKLDAMEKSAKPQASKQPSAAEAAALRKRLAERITTLAKQ